MWLGMFAVICLLPLCLICGICYSMLMCFRPVMEKNLDQHHSYPRRGKRRAQVVDCSMEEGGIHRFPDKVEQGQCSNLESDDDKSDCERFHNEVMEL